MKFLSIILILCTAATTWSKPAEISTPTGRIVCGGTVDKKDLLFAQIPTTTVLKGVEDVDPEKETAIVFIDFAKKDQAKIAIVWGMSDAEFERYEKRKEELATDELFRWLGSSKSVFWVGFTNGFVQLDMERGAHTLSLSCSILAPPAGPKER